MNPSTTTQPHQSLGKFILYVVVAIIFFVGGYYIGKGNLLAAQSASIYGATKDMGALASTGSTTAAPGLLLRNWCIKNGGTYTETQSGLWGAGEIVRNCKGAHGALVQNTNSDVVLADISSPEVAKALAIDSSNINAPGLLLRNWCIKNGGTYTETQSGLWGAGEIVRTCSGAHGALANSGTSNILFVNLSSPTVVKALQSASNSSVPVSTTGGNSDTGAALVAFGNSGAAPAFMPKILCDILGGRERNHVTNLGGGNYQYDYTGCLFGTLTVSGNDIYSYASTVAKKNNAANPAVNVTQ